MSLRVAVNLLTFNSEAITGVGYFFKRLFEALPPLPDVEFTFFCQRSFQPGNVLRVPDGVRVRRVTAPDFRSKFARILYEQLVLPFRCRNMDVLFSPCAANPVMKIGYRTVTTIHDLTPFVVQEKYGKLQGAYVRGITRLLARSSTTIVTISDHSKSDIARRLRVPDSRIRIVHNVVVPRMTSDVRYEPYFLTVGTRQPAKNIDGVIRSFARFREKYDREDHRLVVVGAKGWGTDDHERLAASLGIADSVEFRGYLSESDLDRLYAHCKGHIILSFYEGFGIPVLEALAWRKPSVFSNVSSLPEVAGKTGIGVAPLDVEEAARALANIAQDPIRHLKGVDEQLDKFSPSRQVAAFLSVLMDQPPAESPSLRIPCQ